MLLEGGALFRGLGINYIDLFITEMDTVKKAFRSESTKLKAN